MDSPKYHIVYASRRAREDAVVRATEDLGTGFDREAGGEETDVLGDDLGALLKHGDGELSRTLRLSGAL
ncbi:hypothetical protein IMZ48_04410 [Candidatus Bathyarchaeota archaeon]|nr:hypothetical protein [Candidatus Bathyarchaeota archaeon]